MSTPREFRAAWAGVLFAIFIAIFTKEASEVYEAWILGLLGTGIPFSVFRVLISGHAKEEEYKAAAGFALIISAVSSVLSIFLIILPRSALASVAFLVSTLVSMLLLRARKEKQAP